MRTTLLIFGLSAISILALTSFAEDPKPAAPAAPQNFAGKILVISLYDSGGAVLESAELKTMGQRTFVVGTGINMGNQDWRAGRKVWLAVNDIHQVVEFDTVEEAKKSYEIAFQNPAPRPQRPARKPNDGL